MTTASSQSLKPQVKSVGMIGSAMIAEPGANVKGRNGMNEKIKALEKFERTIYG
jgi:hypothetical protein